MKTWEDYKMQVKDSGPEGKKEIEDLEKYACDYEKNTATIENEISENDMAGPVDDFDSDGFGVRFKPHLCDNASYESEDLETISNYEEEFCFMHKFMIDAKLVNEDGEEIKKIGIFDATVILPYLVGDNAAFILQRMDDTDQECSDIITAIKYYAHETNYKQYGFEYPYEPFIFTERVYVDSKYRNKGIAKMMMAVAVKYLAEYYGYDISLFLFQVGPIIYNSAKDSFEPDPKAAENIGTLIKIYKALGAVEFDPDFDIRKDDKYFYYRCQ